MFAAAEPPIGAPSVGDRDCFRARFGEEEMVVTVVVAVLGRSPEVFDAEANRPEDSRFLIRFFNSSSSSQTADGGGPESTDSDPSAPFALVPDCSGVSIWTDSLSREDAYCR